MLTDNIPIYRSMYKLLQMLIELRNNFDKPYKYVVGDRLIDTAMECLRKIHYANEDKRPGARVEHIDAFLIDFDVLKTYIMVCRDGRQIKKSTALADLFLLVADVEKQAAGWRRASRKPES